MLSSLYRFLRWLLHPLLPFNISPLIKRCARFEGQEFDLQPTEYRVLEFMMRHPGQVLTRTMIFEAVWGGRFDPGTNLIDVHIGRLRKKLDGLASQPLIRTVRGSGYRLC